MCMQIADVQLLWNQIITKEIYKMNSQMHLLPMGLIIRQKRYLCVKLYYFNKLHISIQNTNNIINIFVLFSLINQTIVGNKSVQVLKMINVSWLVVYIV